MTLANVEFSTCATHLTHSNATECVRRGNSANADAMKCDHPLRAMARVFSVPALSIILLAITQTVMAYGVGVTRVHLTASLQSDTSSLSTALAGLADGIRIYGFSDAVHAYFPDCPNGAFQVTVEYPPNTIIVDDQLQAALRNSGINLCDAPTYVYDASHSALPNTQITVWLSAAVLTIGLGGLLVLAHRSGVRMRPTIEAGSVVGTTLKHLGASLLCTAVLISAYLGNYFVIHPSDLSIPERGDYSYLPSALKAYLIVGIPLIEELAFRTWLLHHLQSLLRPTFAIALSAVTFAIAHGDPPSTMFLIVAGIALSVLWWKTRSYFCCVLAHSTYNAWVLL